MNICIEPQKTLAEEIRFQGVGLHSGARISVAVKPARPDSGILFRRVDLPGRPLIAARYPQVVDTRLATTIGSRGAQVSTIEHLMAAFFGAGIDNALVELDGSEVPILDGSAAPYLDVLEQAGIAPQAAARRYLRIERTVLVRDGDAYIKATPASRFSVSYCIDFPHPLVGRQEFSYEYNPASFQREIARARTFGFLKDVEKLQSMGLARGGSLENALVFDDYTVLNREGFRYSNECVRHKVLDLLGDLSLAGMPMTGHFEVHKAGHSLHNRFLRELFDRPGAFAVCQAAVLPVPLYPHGPMPAPAFHDCFRPVGHPLVG